MNNRKVIEKGYTFMYVWVIFFGEDEGDVMNEDLYKHRTTIQRHLFVFWLWTSVLKAITLAVSDHCCLYN